MGKRPGIPHGLRRLLHQPHEEADQNDIENLATLLVTAGCNYIMGVPEGDDCMLMYQCTATMRLLPCAGSLACAPSTKFDMWLEDGLL